MNIAQQDNTDTKQRVTIYLFKHPADTELIMLSADISQNILQYFSSVFVSTDSWATQELLYSERLCGAEESYSLFWPAVNVKHIHLL